jgi:hypothetical protein
MLVGKPAFAIAAFLAAGAGEASHQSGVWADTKKDATEAIWSMGRPHYWASRPEKVNLDPLHTVPGEDQRYVDVHAQQLSAEWRNALQVAGLHGRLGRPSAPKLLR